MYWMRSWPWPAATSAAIRPGISVLLMWSTVTLTPTLLPQSLTKGSNHLSCAGTKWLHNRIDKDPDNFDAGSLNAVSVGAPADEAACAGDGPAVVLSLPHAARKAAAAADWMNARRVIPGQGNVPMAFNLPRGLGGDPPARSAAVVESVAGKPRSGAGQGAAALKRAYPGTSQAIPVDRRLIQL